MIFCAFLVAVAMCSAHREVSFDFSSAPTGERVFPAANSSALREESCEASHTIYDKWGKDVKGEDVSLRSLNGIG